MLNISRNSINKQVDLKGYISTNRVFHQRYYKHFNRFLKGFGIMILILFFLPWTQNVTGKGYLTTLKPDQRPQTIQSPIPGRIEKWYVQEGDYVKKGDTILFISEIKNEYFDPNLVSRTGDQIRAKSASVVSYEGKVNALRN
ncbi:MAG: biotin/lipoyl-binding protein, partial [Maribacter sp.]